MPIIPLAPCLPTRGTKVPAGPDWIHEVNYDGYRLLVARNGKRVRLLTRHLTARTFDSCPCLSARPNWLACSHAGQKASSLRPSKRARLVRTCSGRREMIAEMLKGQKGDPDDE
jgi:hypothetical protein